MATYEEHLASYPEIAAALEPWTPEHSGAAIQEGWNLWTTTSESGSPVQVQHIDEEEECPGAVLDDDTAAMVIVRDGTDAHHQVARQILQTHFPAEWALVLAAK